MIKRRKNSLLKKKHQDKCMTNLKISEMLLMLKNRNQLRTEVAEDREEASAGVEVVKVMLPQKVKKKKNNIELEMMESVAVANAEAVDRTIEVAGAEVVRTEVLKRTTRIVAKSITSQSSNRITTMMVNINRKNPTTSKRVVIISKKVGNRNTSKKNSTTTNIKRKIDLKRAVKEVTVALEAVASPRHLRLRENL